MHKKKRMKKKGFQLSLNMIIMVIMAFVFLGLAIALITNWMNSIRIPDFPTPKIKPTADNAMVITYSDIEVKRGKIEKIVVEVFNRGDNKVNCKLGFESSNPGNISFKYNELGKNIDVDEIGTWRISVKTGKTTKKDVYIYSVKAECGEFEESRDLTIEVK